MKITTLARPINTNNVDGNDNGNYKSLLSFKIGFAGKNVQGLVNDDARIAASSTKCVDTTNKNCACCRPFTIPGLAKLLEKDEPTSSSTTKITKKSSYTSILGTGIIKPYDTFPALERCRCTVHGR